jgi:ATP-dependent Clp protease ATP-binding subunit ClpA
MTTNAGAQNLASAAFGFTRNKREGDDQEAINHLFTPEFRNRLDAVVSFGHLPPEIVRKVVEKFIMQLEAQLSERQVNIELSEAAANWLAEKGYDQQMGARPLARVIQEYVKKPLADEVLFGRLAQGGTVKILLGPEKDGEATLAFEYLGREQERALPKQPDRKALPGKSAKPKAVGKAASKSKPKKKSVH